MTARPKKEKGGLFPSLFFQTSRAKFASFAPVPHRFPPSNSYTIIPFSLHFHLCHQKPCPSTLPPIQRTLTQRHHLSPNTTRTSSTVETIQSPTVGITDTMDTPIGIYATAGSHQPTSVHSHRSHSKISSPPKRRHSRMGARRGG